MKVLHVIPSIAPVYGGPSKVVVDICKNLNSEGIDTTIATTNAGFGNKCFPLNEETEYKDVRTIFFKKQIGESFKYSRPLEKWLLRNVSGYDLVHIHAIFNHATVAAFSACRKAKVPYILRPLGSLDPWSLNQKKLFKEMFLWIFGDKIIRNASGIHYTTVAEKELAESRIKSAKGFVVPLSVDGSYLDYAPDHRALARHGISKRNKYILFLSRIHYKKGIELLIDAFNRLNNVDKFKDYRLVIAGDGESEYVCKIKELAGHNGNIVFTGWLGEEEKKSFLSHAEILALPSYQENFGLCLIEAMAMGVPVLVSTKVNIAEDIVSASAGIICELNKDSVYNSLKNILSDSKKLGNCRNASRKLVKDSFTAKASTKKLIDMYSSVID